MDYCNIKFVAHLSDNHQLKAADKLISELRIELGKDESYISELEEQLKYYQSDEYIKNINEEIEKVKQQNLSYRGEIKRLNVLLSEIGFQEQLQKKNEEIKSLEKKITELRNTRDILISKLYGERNS